MAATMADKPETDRERLLTPPSLNAVLHSSIPAPSRRVSIGFWPAFAVPRILSSSSSLCGKACTSF